MPTVLERDITEALRRLRHARQHHPRAVPVYEKHLDRLLDQIPTKKEAR